MILLAAQAAGQEITTFHPLPPKEQQNEEIRQAQGLPAARPAPAAAGAPAAPGPGAPAKPPAEEIKVTSVRVVPPDANVIWVPPPEEPR